MGYTTSDGAYIDYDDPDVPVYSAEGGNAEVYIHDLPMCCNRQANQTDGSFECPSCGATWIFLNCAECGGALSGNDAVDHTYRKHGIEVRRWVCSRCDEAIHDEAMGQLP